MSNIKVNVMEDLLAKSETQLLNSPIRIEYVILSGQTESSSGYRFLDADFYLHNWKALYKNYKLNIETRQPKISSTDSSILTSTRKEELPDYYNRNLKLLRNIFSEEYKKIGKNLILCKEPIFNIFDLICRNLSELDFEEGTVELTDANNIKFTLIFPDNKVLMVSKSILPGHFNFNNDDIIFSLFVNKKLIASDVSEISFFIEGFKKYLAM
jgi:hypothetical protein